MQYMEMVVIKKWILHSFPHCFNAVKIDLNYEYAFVSSHCCV